MTTTTDLIERMPLLYRKLTSAGVSVRSIGWHGYQGDTSRGRILIQVLDVDEALFVLGMTPQQDQKYGHVNDPQRQVIDGDVSVFGPARRDV